MGILLPARPRLHAHGEHVDLRNVRINSFHPLADYWRFSHAGDWALTPRRGLHQGTILADGVLGQRDGRGQYVESTDSASGLGVIGFEGAGHSFKGMRDFTIVAGQAIDAVTNYSDALNSQWDDGVWSNPFVHISLNQTVSARAAFDFTNTSSTFCRAEDTTSNYWDATGAFHTYSASKYDDGTDWFADFYRDGVIFSSAVTGGSASGAFNVGSNSGSRVCVMGASNNTTALGRDGRAFFGHVFSRTLTAEEHAEIHRDPFAMFLPSAPVVIFTAAAAGGTITGTGAITLAAMTMAGTAEREITGSGAITTAAQTVAGTAEREIPGSGAITLAAQTVAGTAEREIPGSGAITLAAQTMAGTGSVTSGVSGTGALTLAAQTVAGTAERAITGTGAITHPSMTLAGTAEREIPGSGAITFAAMTLTGAGTVGNAVIGSGALTLAAQTVSGTAERAITGTGAITMGAAILAGVGVRTITGTGALTLPATTLAGTAERVITGSGALTLAAMTVFGTQAALSALRTATALTSLNKIIYAAGNNVTYSEDGNDT